MQLDWSPHDTSTKNRQPWQASHSAETFQQKQSNPPKFLMQNHLNSRKIGGSVNHRPASNPITYQNCFYNCVLHSSTSTFYARELLCTKMRKMWWCHTARKRTENLCVARPSGEDLNVLYLYCSCVQPGTLSWKRNFWNCTFQTKNMSDRSHKYFVA